MTSQTILNRQARHDYLITETYEVGIVLSGTEVKSIRRGMINLKDSFVLIEDNELWLYNSHIAVYEWGNRFNHEPTAKRKLLMHKRQILKLKSITKEQGLSIIPTKMYFKNNLIKVEIGLGKGKKLYDKRETLKANDNRKDIARIIKNKDWQ